MPDTVQVVANGARELIQRFDTFPQYARERIVAHMQTLIERLYGAVESRTPVLTGQLRSEEQRRVYDDSPNRIAGYVSVQAPDSNQAAKAAALEYGSNQVGRRMGAGLSRLHARITSGPRHLEARRYLRDSLADIEGDVQAELSQALDEAANA